MVRSARPVAHDLLDSPLAVNTDIEHALRLAASEELRHWPTSGSVQFRSETIGRLHQRSSAGELVMHGIRRLDGVGSTSKRLIFQARANQADREELR